MATIKNFVSGIIAGFLNLFITPFVIGFIPAIPYSFYILQPLLFGLWVFVATIILERFWR
jgi:polyferredoxin